MKKGKSLPQNIDDLFFAPGAPLQNEYENLYKALFNKPDHYIKIIEALSSVNKGISRDEISKKTGIAKSGDLSKNSWNWKTLSNFPSVNSWSGVAFERVCLEHVAEIKKALGISGVFTETNAWACSQDDELGIQGSQIDLLIVRKDQIINVCEMKYSETYYVVDAEFDRAQRRKISDFQQKTNTKYALHSTLITTYGVAANLYSGDIQSIITAEDLFA